MRLALTTIAAAAGIVTAVGIAAPAEAQPYRHGGYGYHHGYDRPHHEGRYRERYWRHHRDHGRHYGRYDRHPYRGYYGRHW